MEDFEAKSGFDWEKFPFFNLSSTSPQRKIQLKEWSMVVIRDSLPNDDYSVFPPSNHENLHPASMNEHERGNPVSVQSDSPSTSFRSSSSSSSSSLSSFSFSDDDTAYSPSPIPSSHDVKKFKNISRWMVLGVQILRVKITAMASTIWSETARKTTFWLFSPAARIVIALTLWWLYKRARQRRLRRSTDRLKMIIKEKDEKIGRLLHQIAELNGVLVAQQKGLPSK